MSPPSNAVEAQLQALLALIHEQKEGRCQRLAEESAAQRQRILGEAHAEARQRMQRAIDAERREAGRQLQMARAQLRGRRRERTQQTARRMLDHGWEQLKEALAARWNDPTGQREWLQGLLEQARASLPRGRWRIEHPAAWPAPTAEAFARQVAELSGANPTLEADPQLQSGARLHAEGACLDGSLDGLLVHRQAVESRLLAHLQPRP